MRSVSDIISLPVSAATAFRVVSDLNTLIRLSPFFSLKNYEPSNEETSSEGSVYSVTLDYYEKNMIETHRVEVDIFENEKKISYHISNGILTKIIYEISEDDHGIRLGQTFLLESDDEALLKGSQNELHFWLRSVGEYLKLAEGNSFTKSAMKWLMDRVWLRLTLSERKIAIIMAKVTVLELALLLVLVLIWNIAGPGR